MAHLKKLTSVRYTVAGKHVPKGTPGAAKSVTKSKSWYAFGLPGRSKPVRLSPDKRAASRMLDDLARAAERGRAGLPDDAAAGKPLSEHLAEYAEAVALGLAGGKSRRAPGADHAAIAARYPAVVFAEALGYASASDFGPHTPTAVAKLLRTRNALPKADGGWSAQTCNNHLAGCKRFVRWLAAKRVPVAADLLDALPAMDAANHRTRLRRECTPAELGLLLAAARAGGVSYALTGPQRHALYVAAFGTGFRVTELSTLTVGQFDLASDPPAVVIAGRASKAKRRVRQPLPPDVARELAPFLAGRPAGELAWPAGSWSGFAADMLRGDLEAAGVAYSLDTPDGPAVIDFHALRHSYVSALAAAGVGVKELQELARHSDPRLTIGTYTHARAGALAASVGKIGLPGVQAAPAELTREELAAAAFALGVVAGRAMLP